MIAKHRAYELLAGLILFNLAIPVAVAMGFSGPIVGKSAQVGGSKTIVDLYLNGFGSWTFWTSVGVVSGLLIVASRLGGIRVTFSSIIYSGVFLSSAAPLNSILGDMTSAGWIPSSISALIVGTYAIAFIIGMIEVSR